MGTKLDAMDTKLDTTNTKRALIVCPLVTQAACARQATQTTTPYDVSIAVDGGAEWFYRQKITPDFAVGDFDSAGTAVLDWLQASSAQIRQVPQDKEYSDLELALQICSQQQLQSATILGAVGGRIDHQLCVLGTLLRSSVAELTLQDASQSLRLLRAGQSLNLETAFFPDAISKTFSVISLQEAVVTIAGARWPLDQVTLKPLSSHGLSNEASNEMPTTVTVTKGSAFVIAIL